MQSNTIPSLNSRNTGRKPMKPNPISTTAIRRDVACGRRDTKVCQRLYKALWTIFRPLSKLSRTLVHRMVALPLGPSLCFSSYVSSSKMANND